MSNTRELSQLASLIKVDDETKNIQLGIESSNVGIGTTNPKFKLEVGSVGASGTTLYVHGDARITGILSVGQGTITLDPSQNIVSIGTAIVLNSTLGTISVQGSTISDPYGNASYSGIVTASIFYGDGSNLTGITSNAFTLNNQQGSYYLDYNNFTNKPSIPSNTSDLVNNSGFVTSGIVVGYATVGYVDNSIVGFITSGALGGYATEGYVNNLVSISTFSGNYNDLSNKPFIPSNTGDLSNNAGFVTSSIVVGYATEGYVNTSIANLVNSAPATLDTLNELASALGNDANFSTTITNSLAGKANLTGANFTGIVTATSFNGSLTGTATSTTNIPNLTGDVTSTNTTTTLATVNNNVGTYGSSTAIPSITVNAKGLVTGVTTNAITVGDGTLTLNVSGTGLSGSQTFSANQSGNATFTVDSNATSGNTNNTIVSRNDTGGFSAGIVTATSFVKSSGTSSQFLKADGSVDTNTYLTSYAETDTLNSVTGRGNNTSNGISVGIFTATSGNFSGIITSSGSAIYGNVGVGITNPTSKLHVLGDSLITGVATATGGFNLGISSAGTSITSGPVTRLNFVGTGNTFSVNGTTIDISISGGGGGGVTITNDTSTNSTFYPTFTSVTTGSVSGQSVSSTKLSFNPSTGVLAATTFSGSGASLTSIPNSATTATNTNTASAIVTRDASGNFSAGTITANLTGTATTATNTAVTNDTTTNATYYPTFVSATTGNLPQTVSSTKLTFNPSTGALTATDINSSSDVNLKENIRNIDNPLESVLKLNGVRFDWKETKETSIGVIAQELEKIYPELVKNGETKAVNYNGLIGVLIEAIKEQQKQIENLTQMINKSL